MKNKITEIDLRSPEYKGFWRDILAPQKGSIKKPRKP